MQKQYVGKKYVYFILYAFKTSISNTEEITNCEFHLDRPIRHIDNIREIEKGIRKSCANKPVTVRTVTVRDYKLLRVEEVYE